MYFLKTILISILLFYITPAIAKGTGKAVHNTVYRNYKTITSTDHPFPDQPAEFMSLYNPGLSFHSKTNKLAGSGNASRTNPQPGPGDPATAYTAYKILHLKIMLEGLYAGEGLMNPANDAEGPHFGNGVADQITIELHSASNYSNIQMIAGDVNLSVTGNALLAVPDTLHDSYYVTVKDRNHIQITSGFPVSFAGSSITYDFSSDVTEAYGNNLKLIDGQYMLIAGDVNQDGVINFTDQQEIESGAANFVTGYTSTDLNGDGMIDVKDMILLDNNSFGSIGDILPLSHPLFLSAATSTDGQKVEVTFSKMMANPIGTESQFHLRGRNVTSVNLKQGDSSDFILQVSVPFTCQDSIQLDYNKGSVIAADGSSLESFRGAPVANHLYNPDTDTTLSTWIHTRNGISLHDDKGNNSTILLPHMKFGTSRYAYVADNGGLDIGSSNFTFCGWFKSETSSTASYRFIAGKNINAGTNGRYGFYMNAGDSKIIANVQSSGGSVDIPCNINFNTAGWVFLRLEIDQSTSKVRFYVNETLAGTEKTYTGTFATLDNKYEFYIGGGNTVSGGNGAYPAQVSAADVYVFNRLLTAAEINNLRSNRVTVTGSKAHYPMSSGLYFDCSGNGYKMISPTMLDVTLVYDTAGSRQSLDLGYSLYKKSSAADLQVPYLDAGTAMPNPVLPAGYYLFADHPANGIHNLADSYVQFDAASWDRSDTIAFSHYARAATTSYLTSNPKAWHISELEILKIKLFANTGYKAMHFPGIHGGGDRDYMEEIMSVLADKSGNELRSILQRTHNYDAWHDIEFVFDSRNIVATRFNHMLILNGARYLQYSSNGGNTIDRQVDLGVGHFIKFAYIYENGFMVFATNDKVYYSHDQLLTIHEATVLDINGNPYTPPAFDAYLRFAPDRYFKYGSFEMPVWGTYSVFAGTASTEINGWYTKDYGMTIRSFIHFPGTGTFADVRHIHAINYNFMDHSFWLQTGDGSDNYNTCQWYKCMYDTVSDTWTNTLIKNGSYTSFFKTVGFAFFDNYVYFGEDSQHHGIWRVPYSLITDESKYEKVSITDGNGNFPEEVLYGFMGDENGYVFGEYASQHKYIMISTDRGKSWYTHEITGGPALMADYGGYYGIRPASENGVYVLDVAETGESYTSNYQGGTTLLLKIIKP